MKPFATLVAVFSALLLAASPAKAHRPYFTQVEHIALPDGQPGELRLLNGDGILASDPIWVIALDAQGRLLARSPQTRTLILSCGGERKCRAYDFDENRVFELDSATFRVGDPVPDLSDERRELLWKIDTSGPSWGWSVRHATVFERVRANLALGWKNLPAIFMTAMFGFVAGLGLFSPMRRPRLTPMGSLVAWLVFAVVRLCTIAIAFIGSVIFAGLLFAISDDLWLLSFAGGAAVEVLALYLGRPPAKTVKTVET